MNIFGTRSADRKKKEEKRSLGRECYFQEEEEEAAAAVSLLSGFFFFFARYPPGMKETKNFIRPKERLLIYICRPPLLLSASIPRVTLAGAEGSKRRRRRQRQQPKVKPKLISLKLNGARRPSPPATRRVRERSYGPRLPIRKGEKKDKT